MQELEKENYVRPEFEVINIETEGILCASDPSKGQSIYGESDRWGGSWGDEF